MRHLLARIGVRLLLVNLMVLLVPAFGLEFARIYETQLLGALERDMRNQSALVRAEIETRLEQDSSPTVTDSAPHVERMVARAARSTRTRIRVLDERGALIADSHQDGPPEGAEQDAPTVWPEGLSRVADDVRSHDGGPKWPEVADRDEVRSALAGSLSTRTRIRGRAPAVLLFLAEPVLKGGRVRGVVYVTRSTQPVLTELYRIRSGLMRVLGVALLVTSAITLALALSISRPLGRLARAARRVADGELAVPIPTDGSGEVRELGEAFRTMKERLLERLRFSGDFAADVAHELKSPLTSIRGAAELLGEGAWKDDEARGRFLRNIELDVERLDALVSRLLVLGRIEASDAPMEPVDMVALARRVAERVADVEAPVEVHASGPVPEVLGRASDLEIALTNLVENAVRYSPVGVPVDVIVKRGKAGGLRLSVVDRGPGISEPNQAKIWRRFFSTDHDRGGSGLGLSIVKSVIEAHGGSVRCVSAVGKGARFEVDLPENPDPGAGARGHGP